MLLNEFGNMRLNKRFANSLMQSLWSGVVSALNMLCIRYAFGSHAQAHTWENERQRWEIALWRNYSWKERELFECALVSNFFLLALNIFTRCKKSPVFFGRNWKQILWTKLGYKTKRKVLNWIEKWLSYNVSKLHLWHKRSNVKCGICLQMCGFAFEKIYANRA